MFDVNKFTFMYVNQARLIQIWECFGLHLTLDFSLRQAKGSKEEGLIKNSNFDVF